MIIPFRAESLLSVAEFIKVKRSTDDDPDDNAADAAANLDHLSITRDGERVASKVRFDLDLPSAAEDDVVLGDGIPLPEWDYRKNLLLEDHVRLMELTPSVHDPRAAPSAAARAPAPHRTPPAPPVRRAHPGPALAQGPGRRQRARPRRGGARRHRSRHRPPPVRPALPLAGEARARPRLPGAGRPVPVHRFLGLVRGARHRRHPRLAAAVRRGPARHRRQLRAVRLLLGQAQQRALPPPQGLRPALRRRARGRIMAIKPGYYTRLGAAIRHATSDAREASAPRAASC